MGKDYTERTHQRGQAPGDNSQLLGGCDPPPPLLADVGGCDHHLSCPLACDCPAMASMMASCEYMLIGVLYWACTMVAFPPGPLTSMGLWVDRAESFSAFGLKLGVYSTLPRSGVSGADTHGGREETTGSACSNSAGP